MTDSIFDRYKDALRRGHVAALRGRYDAAVVAYDEAASLAPDRALPHASLGGVLHKLGRNDAALAAYGIALERAPGDETALSGRAEVLAVEGRRVEAAETLATLAETLERAGRLPEAVDAARRSLETAESKSRRRLVERLANGLAASPVDEAGAAALAEAIRVLEPPVIEPEPEPEPEIPPPDGTALALEAQALLDAGDRAGAVRQLVAAAAAHRATGRLDAALDDCYLALPLAPADGELHLTLAGIYLDRGWQGPAVEKLLLLGRLVELAGDAATRDRLCALVSDRLPDEPRLAALCA